MFARMHHALRNNDYREALSPCQTNKFFGIFSTREEAYDRQGERIAFHHDEEYQTENEFVAP